MTTESAEPVIAAIDHLLTYVRDGAAAADTFRRLGFTLSPVSQIESMGITNQMVLFADAAPGTANFIELMSVSDPARLPPPMAALLGGEERIKSMVLSTEDAFRCHAHLAAQGLPFAAPIHVRREWRLDDGTSVHPEFDVILPQTAGLTFNACRYHNVEHYRRPDWTTHPNGVTGLDAALVVAPDPAALADRFARILHCPVRRHDGCHIVAAGGVTLDIFAPEDLSTRYGLDMEPPADPLYVGYRLRARDPAVLAGFARRADIPVSPAGAGFTLSPAAMYGNLVEVTARAG
ncbi:VOC family protein [Phreatobacter sp.]|uniref:VOC family protein n=1 Tax=Phreatobacter sp. TaxID=1966341 RepID=UPI0025D26A55|nr:VOC family protein [Phreatobacter sp.]